MVLLVKQSDGKGSIELYLPADREARIREVINAAQEVGYTANINPTAWRENYRPRYAVQLTVPTISGRTLVRLAEFYKFYTPPSHTVDDGTAFLDHIINLKDEVPTNQHHLIGPARMIGFYLKGIYTRQENMHLAQFAAHKSVIDPLIDHIREQQPSFAEVQERYNTLLRLLENGVQPSLALETYPELRAA